jgi:hypothetical protein
VTGDLGLGEEEDELDGRLGSPFPARTGKVMGRERPRRNGL